MFAHIALLTLVFGAIGANTQSCSGPPYTVVSGDTCANIAANLVPLFKSLKHATPALMLIAPTWALVKFSRLLAPAVVAEAEGQEAAALVFSPILSSQETSVPKSLLSLGLPLLSFSAPTPRSMLPVPTWLLARLFASLRLEMHK
ncbi:hypothetical protein D9757_014679 [Collybiopsis confluens]|uniref:Uncharacterized protein n=1 Tax=Collybiopsis confluens TaxID=2823264 RepID=A0A8H5CKY7_9AGAR|nr:hypothetical protein D9757_014679 [Collybiopsis confluens]